MAEGAYDPLFCSYPLSVWVGRRPIWVKIWIPLVLVDAARAKLDGGNPGDNWSARCVAMSLMLAAPKLREVRG